MTHTLRFQFHAVDHRTGLSAFALALGMLALSGLVSLRAADADTRKAVAIVIDQNTTKVGNTAATELSAYLTKLHPTHSFPVSREANTDQTIVLSVNPSGKDLPECLEGYVVSADGNKALIASRSEAGLLNGVYGLLDHLGVGFYLSVEILPAPAADFSFHGWQLRNEPLVKDRYVFNWHNFLSGCTGWDEEHWMEWVGRSRKMGYNAIMIHAYFNNPMHTYSFNGLAKRNGYYATSAIGRDWGSVPIDGDIRRLPGGEIFDGPVLGCEAVTGPEGQSADSVQAMMKKVFAHAADRGMGICFAFDADMTLTFVQDDFIRQMPPAGKFMVRQGKTGVPNPDTAEGQAYFTAQIKGLIDSYPMLTQIGCWVRGKSWLSEIKPEELPTDWQKDLAQITASHSELEAVNPGDRVRNYLVAKIVVAYEEALKDLGRADIEVVTGSWESDWVLPAAILLPHTKLMPIDWQVRNNQSLIENPKLLAMFDTHAKGRVIPFLWSHHDDGHYIGRCYPPADRLATKLKQAGANGVGVFHWLNRPQDLYFKNVERQIWAGSVDETCRTTCDQMALDYFGDPALGSYLSDWVKDAPIFGRATLPNMFSRAMNENRFTEKHRVDGEKRLAFLKTVDRKKMNPAQSGRLDYFQTLEQFNLEFMATQHQLDLGEKLIKEGRIAQAREALAKGDPERTVRTYAKLSGKGHQDRGEIAYTVSMAGKWIGEYDSFRQRARTLPVKIKLGNTFPEPLAQGNANLCYYLDSNGKFWEKLGSEVLLDDKGGASRDSNSAVVLRKATGKETPMEEWYLEGIRLGTARIPIRPIMRASGVANASEITKGSYRLRIFASSDAGGAFALLINGIKKEFTVKEDTVLELEVDLLENAQLTADCTRTSGDLVLHGLSLEPQGLQPK